MLGVVFLCMSCSGNRSLTIGELNEDAIFKDPHQQIKFELEPRHQARVVFSGHSLTHPAVYGIRPIASSKKSDLKSVYQSIPGSPIRVRTRGHNIKDKNDWSGYGLGLAKGRNLLNEFKNPTILKKGEFYDTLIVTERNDILSTIQWENTSSLLRHFHDRFTESSHNGKTYLYQSWLAIDKSDPDTWIRYEKEELMVWECLTSKANLTLKSDGLPPNIRTLPAGWALAQLVEKAIGGEIPGIEGSQKEILDQIFGDNVHLKPIGKLFIGAITYAEIFGRSPENASIPGEVSKETGKALFEISREIVTSYHTYRTNVIHDMSVCRAHIENKICEPYWTKLLNKPEHLDECRSYFGGETSGNPFRWPDSALKVWPAPRQQ